MSVNRPPRRASASYSAPSRATSRPPVMRPLFPRFRIFSHNLSKPQGEPTQLVVEAGFWRQGLFARERIAVDAHSPAPYSAAAAAMARWETGGQDGKGDLLAIAKLACKARLAAAQKPAEAP